jgi:hypothetical protein
MVLFTNPPPPRKNLYIHIYIDERIYDFYVGNNYFARRNKFGMK